MRKLFLLFTAVLSASGLVARAQSDESLAILKNQSLIVVLKDEEPDKLKKLAKKPGELEAYKSFVKNYNVLIEELAPKIWHFSPSVEFRHEAELAVLVKDKAYRHGVFKHDNFTVLEHLSGGAARGGAIYTSESKTAFLLNIISNGSERTIAPVYLAPGVVRTSDVVFSLKILQSQLEERAAGKSNKDLMAEHGKRLRSKTLLLDEAEMNGKLSAADIKQAYPFAFQLVPRETIESAVNDADARYACVRILPVTGNMTALVIMDPVDGAMLAMSVGGMGLKSGNVVTKGNLKDFAQAAGK
ncbi:hypothetical protein [Hymenobacter convexus]|uniref:hypothetical protein n=1 Tax=Hymenobacter sp. CA1UV-4 TaxID=3063782 RepID=UPI002713BB84|nr:hypothetical protein [Hymenobacter sp. CA1UV-4]MDO7851952.1 hypothetical protein [Hymenobacter sp. CA1UV-4]